MPADQPAGPERRPLDDLRERLARLPAGHPSAPGDHLRPEPEAPDRAREQPGSGEPLPVPGATRERERPGLLEQAARIDRLAKLLGPGERAGPPGRAGSGVADASGAVSPLAGPARREAYRPWFSEADPPWFSADRGDHSG